MLGFVSLLLAVVYITILLCVHILTSMGMIKEFGKFVNFDLLVKHVNIY